MKTFRIVLGILAILPITLFGNHFFIHSGEDSLQEMIYMVPGITILILNLWAWTYPQIIEVYFFGRKVENR